ncbi:hypothetical protein Golob_025248 [Gossypium lobatum]|uniref:Retrovirus-related Pol polyprotein from transposon TNT 1-94 n=1 Tax=Gossypium lobatum TaxID=34289 RepID=A0A7J8NKN6_9ROSI|nr:hypothetical protein [Gossypium lobatum]
MATSPSAVQSDTLGMASIMSEAVVDSRFFAIKKISVLLDDTNYLLWRQQVVSEEGILQDNLAFSRFQQQDCALASWLLSSQNHFSIDVLSKGFSFSTKGELSMKDFLKIIKSYCDSLASCGEVITDQEHVTAIINGLPPDYEAVIAIITTSSSANLVSYQAPTSVPEPVNTAAYRPSTNVRIRGHGRSFGSHVRVNLVSWPPSVPAAYVPSQSSPSVPTAYVPS